MVTKIEKSGLVSVVQSMVEENPNVSDQKVANALMRDYADKLEGGKITWFAVHNLRKKLDGAKILDNIDDNVELDDVAMEEFNKIMKDGAEKAEVIYNQAKDNNDLATALKGLEQIRRNWVSMMDFYKKHIIPPIQNITINEDKKVIFVLQRYQHILCPNCRERVNREILLGNEEK